MKKILTASLVAMMAVTAARAEIASTQYVTSKVSSAQNTLQGSINTVAGNLANEVTRATGVESGLDTRIEALETASGAGGTTANAIAAAQAAADQAQDEVDNLEGVVSAMDAAYKGADQTLDGKITPRYLATSVKSGVTRRRVNTGSSSENSAMRLMVVSTTLRSTFTARERAEAVISISFTTTFPSREIPNPFSKRKRTTFCWDGESAKSSRIRCHII